MLKLFFRLFLIIGFQNFCFGQTDTSAYAKDSLQKLNKIIPKIRIGADVSRLFLSATRRDFKGFEGSLDANFGKNIYELHVGFANQSQKLEKYRPISSGIYASVGYSKNIFAESDNILSMGGRLAGSSFNYQPTEVEIEDDFSTTKKMLDLEKRASRALWAEFVTSMKAKVLVWIMMGFEVRIKARIQAKADGYQPYVIPGYGFYTNKTSLGFNYFVFINLPAKIKK